MEKLVVSLQHLIVSGWDVLAAISALLVPCGPLIAWGAFWLFAVNWGKLYPILAKGGVIGVGLIGLMMILVWGLVLPEGGNEIFGLKPTNFVAKTFYVTLLFTIAALCGTVQLSGACGSLIGFSDEDNRDLAEQTH